MFLFANILDKFENAPDWVRIILFAGLFAYEPLCMALGCTLGNYLERIRVGEAQQDFFPLLHFCVPHIPIQQG